MNETEIKRRMMEIRDTLDRMVIDSGSLRWEYLQLNQELGRIERGEIEREKRRIVNA